MDEIIKFFDANKDIVFLTLGFLFATAGAIIGWLLNRWTVKQQLEHDAIERDKERKYQMIKDVYLDAYESILKIIAYLQLLSPNDVKINEKKEKQIIEHPDIDIRYDKLELVASENTLKTFSKFFQCYLKTQYKLELKLWPFLKIKLKLVEIQNQLEFLSNFRDKIHDDRMALIKDPDHDQSLIQYLNNQFEEQCEKIETKSNESIELRKKLVLMTLEYDSYKTTTMADLLIATSLLAVDIRKDLEVMLDESEYRIHIEEHHRRMKEIFDDYAEQSKLLIEDFNKPFLKNGKELP